MRLNPLIAAKPQYSQGTLISCVLKLPHSLLCQMQAGVVRDESDSQLGGIRPAGVAAAGGGEDRDVTHVEIQTHSASLHSHQDIQADQY